MVLLCAYFIYLIILKHDIFSCTMANIDSNIFTKYRFPSQSFSPLKRIPISASALVKARLFCWSQRALKTISSKLKTAVDLKATSNILFCEKNELSGWVENMKKYSLTKVCWWSCWAVPSVRTNTWGVDGCYWNSPTTIWDLAILKICTRKKHILVPSCFMPEICPYVHAMPCPCFGSQCCHFLKLLVNTTKAELHEAHEAFFNHIWTYFFAPKTAPVPVLKVGNTHIVYKRFQTLPWLAGPSVAPWELK